MTEGRRWLVLLLVALAAGGAVWWNSRRTAPPPLRAVAPPSGIPRLVDLGAGRCVPCKAMAPILEDLDRDFAGRLEVVFLDVWKDPEAGRAHGVSMIPTQIFYDGQGRELFRHEGFFSRQEILDTWKRLGHPLEPGAR